QFLRPLHQVLAAGERFEFAAATPMENDVPDFAGVEIEAGVKLAVDDDSAADAGADKDAQHVPGSLRRAVRVFAVGAQAHVVFELHLPGPAGRQHAGQLDVVPLKIRGVAHLANARIDLARNADAQATNGPASDAGLLEQILDATFHLAKDALWTLLD